MVRALSASASGMLAQQQNVDNIANNLANVNTTGFKRGQVMFQDMLYDTVRAPGGAQGNGNLTPSGLQLGLGSRMVSIAKDYSPGTLQVTNSPLDVAINGVGFFQVKQPDGSLAYTRDGSFSQNATGNLVTADGSLINGVDAIDPNATAVTIAPNGTVSETVNGATTQKGVLQLYRFANPAGLQALGQNLLSPSDASGQAQAGTPGTDGMGSLQQGSLESSNVQVVTEMVNLIAAQRGYEMNSKAVQASDEMMQSANNMKR